MSLGAEAALREMLRGVASTCVQSSLLIKIWCSCSVAEMTIEQLVWCAIHVVFISTQLQNIQNIIIPQ